MFNQHDFLNELNPAGNYGHAGLPDAIAAVNAAAMGKAAWSILPQALHVVLADPKSYDLARLDLAKRVTTTRRRKTPAHDSFRTAESDPDVMAQRRIGARVALAAIAQNPEEPLYDRFRAAFFAGSYMWCFETGRSSAPTTRPGGQDSLAPGKAQQLLTKLQLGDAAASQNVTAFAASDRASAIAAEMVARMLPEMAASNLPKTCQLAGARMVYTVLGPFNRSGKDALARMEDLLRNSEPNEIKGDVRNDALKCLMASGAMRRPAETQAAADSNVVPFPRPRRLGTDLRV